MNNALFAVITAAFLAIPFHVLAQVPTTSPPSSPIRPADPSIGKWVGEWQSRGRPAGSMEMEVDVKNDQVTGQVRSTGSSGCSLEWAKLTGSKGGRESHREI